MSVHTTVAVADRPLENPHGFDANVHYRLYLGSDGDPTTICVQSFDYHDYDAARILTVDAYDDEPAALRGLNDLLTELVEAPDFATRARTASLLVRAGAPVTRQQALHAYLARRLAEIALDELNSGLPLGGAQS